MAILGEAPRKRAPRVILKIPELGRFDSERRWKCAFFGVALLRFLSCIPFVIDDDEAWMAVSARALKSPFDYYVRAMDNKPPGAVWLYWLADKALFLGRSGFDPRLMRILFTFAWTWVAWILGKIAVQEQGSGDGPKSLQWIASTFFLVASCIASPKLLTTTFDGLLVIFVILGYAVALSPPFRGRSLAAGALLGAGLLVKQTGIFFALPILVGLAFRRFSVREVTGFALGSVLVYLPLVLGTHLSDFVYWNLTYPQEVLIHARSVAFDARSELLGSLVVFCAALFPVLICATGARAKKPIEDFRVLWLIAAAFGTFLGKGLFLHYFLLMIPPLALLAAQGWCLRVRRHFFLSRFFLGWLFLGYLFSCLIVAFPASGLFWGNDLNYYESVGRKIREVTAPGDSVLIWGGTSLPIAFSGVLHSGRFVLPRFAEAPYDTPKSKELFHQEFEAIPPRLVVDLHERGDNQFNNPLASDPFIEEQIKQNYRPYVSPGTPWAKFYLRADRPVVGGLELIRTDEALKRVYEPFPKTPSLWNRLIDDFNSLPRLPIGRAGGRLLALDRYLRARLSLELLIQQSQKPQLRKSAEKLLHEISMGEFDAKNESEVAEFLFQAAHGSEEDLALPWRSIAWWPESAIVELQPKYFKSADCNLPGGPRKQAPLTCN